MFCIKGVLRNFTKFTGKHLCQSLFFNKVASLRPAILLKKGLWPRCFPVSFVKFLRTPFFIEHLRWLLLKVSATSQRWINVINYKPGLENKEYLESSEYLDQFTKTISGEEVKAMFNGSISQSPNRGNWIPVINNINCSSDSSEMTHQQKLISKIKHTKEVIGNLDEIGSTEKNYLLNPESS